MLKRARTSVLEIAYEESGPDTGIPVLLMHGFPYDPRAFDDVVPPLVEAGCRVIVPYLRGYGQTRFLQAVAVQFVVGSRHFDRCFVATVVETEFAEELAHVARRCASRRRGNDCR